MRFFNPLFGFAIFTLLFMSGCSDIPDHDRKIIEGYPKLLERNKNIIIANGDKLNNYINGKNSGFLKPYNDKEHFDRHITMANQLYDKAEKMYKDVIVKKLKNDVDGINGLRILKQEMREFEQKLNSARLESEKGYERAEFLIDARNNAKDIHERTNSENYRVAQINQEINNLLDESANQHPKKAADIENKRLTVSKIVTRANGQFEIVEQENNKRMKDQFVDYALFGDSASQHTKTLAELEDHTRKLKKTVGELDYSYMRILTDQKIDYFVVIKRATWCDGDGCGSGYERTHKPIKVSEKVFEKFDNYTGNLLLKYSDGFFSGPEFTYLFDKQTLDMIGFNPNWINIYSNHTVGEYWLEKAYTRSYHKYTDIIDDKIKENTQWIAVKDNTYWDQFENLGMAILTKPYGYYKSEMLNKAEPVGMAMIAEPVEKDGVYYGANRYGEWRHENGRSFWHYYGMYSLFSNLLGGGLNRYSYNDWNHYNRRKRNQHYHDTYGYYGTYGTRTYGSKSRYKNSSWAKRNPKEVSSIITGNSGTRKSSTSIRGAGASSRGRGPSGSGK